MLVKEIYKNEGISQSFIKHYIGLLKQSPFSFTKQTFRKKKCIGCSALLQIRLPSSLFIDLTPASLQFLGKDVCIYLKDLH